MEHPTINDLPNELLDMIFDQFNVEELKNASLVCKRWSDLAFLGPRMNRVLLVATFPWVKDLLLSNRKYHHLELGGSEKCSAHVKELFEAFNVSSLRIVDFGLSLLRLILWEVPDLQHLSIIHDPIRPYEMIEPFPVMRKLERLEIECNNPKTAIPWHTIAPSLKGLKWDCDSEEQLDQWRHFSGQLKQVHATFRGENSLHRFCEMTFPLLEELSIKFFGSARLEARNSFFTRHEFFRRNGSLRRLSIVGIPPSKTLVKDIANHSKKLTSLEFLGAFYEDEPGSLESLEQLTELKHLKLNSLNTDIYRGCQALTSLQSLCIDETKFGHKGPLGFFEDFFKIAPQLRCLELGSVVMPASAVHFICNKFTKLTRLQLTYSEEVTSNGLSSIDRLPYLLYLKLNLIDTRRLFLSTIPLKNVRYLTLQLGYHYDGNQILLFPENFPQLERLNLFLEGARLRESTVDRLRKLLPTCAIITYDSLLTDAGFKKEGRWRRSREMMPVWEKEWAWKKPFF